jgi:hypothetical protein
VAIIARPRSTRMTIEPIVKGRNFGYLPGGGTRSASK